MLTQLYRYLFSAVDKAMGFFTNYSSMGSSKKGTDFADIPNLILPPDARPALGTNTGSFYGAYSLQQYLWQNPSWPEAGSGIFGQIGIAHDYLDEAVAVRGRKAASR